MANEGIDVTTRYENEEIDIDRLIIDIIRLLKELLQDEFDRYLYQKSEDDWERFKEEEWQNIGDEMFHDPYWIKTEGQENFGITEFLLDKRVWDEQLAIDIILIALEEQIELPVLCCRNLNHIIEPHWDEIGEAVFLEMIWENIEHPPLYDSD